MLFKKVEYFNTSDGTSDDTIDKCPPDNIQPDNIQLNMTKDQLSKYLKDQIFNFFNFKPSGSNQDEKLKELINDIKITTGIRNYTSIKNEPGQFVMLVRLFYKLFDKIKDNISNVIEFTKEDYVNILKQYPESDNNYVSGKDIYKVLYKKALEYFNEDTNPGPYEEKNFINKENNITIIYDQGVVKSGRDHGTSYYNVRIYYINERHFPYRYNSESYEINNNQEHSEEIKKKVGNYMSIDSLKNLNDTIENKVESRRGVLKHIDRCATFIYYLQILYNIKKKEKMDDKDFYDKIKIIIPNNDKINNGLFNVAKELFNVAKEYFNPVLKKKENIDLSIPYKPYLFEKINESPSINFYQDKYIICEVISELMGGPKHGTKTYTHYCHIYDKKPPKGYHKREPKSTSIKVNNYNDEIRRRIETSSNRIKNISIPLIESIKKLKINYCININEDKFIDKYKKNLTQLLVLLNDIQFILKEYILIEEYVTDSKKIIKNKFKFTNDEENIFIKCFKVCKQYLIDNEPKEQEKCDKYIEILENSSYWLGTISEIFNETNPYFNKYEEEFNNLKKLIIENQDILNNINKYLKILVKYIIENCENNNFKNRYQMYIYHLKKYRIFIGNLSEYNLSKIPQCDLIKNPQDDSSKNPQTEKSDIEITYCDIDKLIKYVEDTYTDTESKSGGGLSVGAIIGIVSGIVIFILWLYWPRIKKLFRRGEYKPV